MSSEPRNLVEHAADAGLEAMNEYLAHADASATKILILLEISGAPTGEPDQVVAGHNMDDPADLVAVLAGHFIGAARAVGMQVELIPIATKPQG